MFSLKKQAITSIRNFSTTSARQSPNLAKLTLIGRVGTDLTVQQSASGRSYLRYPLAVNTSKDHTSWFNIGVFDSKTIEYMTGETGTVKKGSLLYVECNAAIQTYETEDGKRGTSLQLYQQSYRTLNSSALPKDE